MNVKAKLSVVVEIPITGNWADDCSVAQVAKQVTDEATDYLRRAIADKKVELVRIEALNVTLTRQP